MSSLKRLHFNKYKDLQLILKESGQFGFALPFKNINKLMLLGEVTDNIFLKIRD